MDKRIIIIQIIAIFVLLLCSCGNKHPVQLRYYCEDTDFSFTMVEDIDSSMLVIGNTDTIVFWGCLDGAYSGIALMKPDSLNVIYLNDTYREVKTIVSHSYQFEWVVSWDTWESNCKTLDSNGGYCEYYGCLKERGGGYSFSYCRNGKYRYLLQPIH